MALLVSACAPETASVTDGGVYPFPKDFDNYETWTSYHFDADDGGSGIDSDSGACTSPHNFSVARNVYVNTSNIDGGFPVGTLLVKETRVSADPSTWQVFGMANVGRDFDPGSACVGWEWYELSVSGGATPQAPAFLWSGLGPVGGYQGCPACTTCHGSATNCILGIPP